MLHIQESTPYYEFPQTLQTTFYNEAGIIELYWDRKRTGAEFYTEKAVRIRTQTQIIDGIGMEARQDFKSWLIKKSVGTVQVPASKFPM